MDFNLRHRPSARVFLFRAPQHHNRPVIDEKEKRPELAIVEVAWSPPPQPGPPARSSIWVLVAANLVALAGVWFWDWRVHDALLLYWMENVVIGGFNVARMLRAEDETAGGSTGTRGYQALLALFFVVHYGGFCLVHGSLLVDFFPAADGSRGLAAALSQALRDALTLFALASIVASHAYSYSVNYIGRGEYRNAAGIGLMLLPYRRLLLTHAVLPVVGFLVIAHGTPAVSMLVFVAVKIGCDVYSHVRAHRLPDLKAW